MKYLLSIEGLKKDFQCLESGIANCNAILCITLAQKRFIV